MQMYTCDYPECDREFDTAKSLAGHKPWHDPDLRTRMSSDFTLSNPLMTSEFYPNSYVTSR